MGPVPFAIGAVVVVLGVVDVAYVEEEPVEVDFGVFLLLLLLVLPPFLLRCGRLGGGRDGGTDDMCGDDRANYRCYQNYRTVPVIVLEPWMLSPLPMLLVAFGCL